jgi:hypothetical protein
MTRIYKKTEERVGVIFDVANFFIQIGLPHRRLLGLLEVHVPGKVSKVTITHPHSCPLQKPLVS